MTPQGGGERTEKFRGACARGSRIQFPVFNVPYDRLWNPYHLGVNEPPSRVSVIR